MAHTLSHAPDDAAWSRQSAPVPPACAPEVLRGRPATCVQLAGHADEWLLAAYPPPARAPPAPPALGVAGMGVVCVWRLEASAGVPVGGGAGGGAGATFPVAARGSFRLAAHLSPSCVALGETRGGAPVAVAGAHEGALAAWCRFVAIEVSAGRPLDDPCADRLALAVDAGDPTRTLLDVIGSELPDPVAARITHLAAGR